jgi:prophage regulatory protein
MHIIIKLPQVKARTGLSRSSIYAFISQGAFPKPIRLGERAVGFLQTEIDEWIESRIKASRNGVQP